MPLVCQEDYAKMLEKNIKKIMNNNTDGQIENVKSKDKRQFVILPKNKTVYLFPIFAKYTILKMMMIFQIYLL